MTLFGGQQIPFIFSIVPLASHLPHSLQSYTNVFDKETISSSSHC